VHPSHTRRDPTETDQTKKSKPDLGKQVSAASPEEMSDRVLMIGMR
jgi:hypothetical protein